jgi:hypothetical protein
MRPVLMTTVSTVCSMLPVAFGTGDGSEWRGPMGVITIGGLLTSTFLTLLVVPVVYTLLDDAATRCARSPLAASPGRHRRRAAQTLIRVMALLSRTRMLPRRVRPPWCSTEASVDRES